MTDTEIATQDPIARVKQAIVANNLNTLTREEQTAFIEKLCEITGMNLLGGPIKMLPIQGRVVPYVTKDGADQLRRIHGIDIKIVGHSVNDAGMLSVHVSGIDKNGRRDEEYGVVAVAGLKGEAAANAFMKAVSKAKRRLILGMVGLGFPDMDDPEEATPTAFSPPRIARPLTAEDLPPTTPVDQPPPPEHQEPEKLDAPVGDEEWLPWCQKFVALVRAAKSIAEIEAWVTLNVAALADLRETQPKRHRMLNQAIQNARQAATEAAEQQ